jgi:hypothetical protein
MCADKLSVCSGCDLGVGIMTSRAPRFPKGQSPLVGIEGADGQMAKEEKGASQWLPIPQRL